MLSTSQLLATLHPKIKPSKPKLCLKMASWTLQEGPKRAQDSPRWAQDGPKEGRRTTSKSRKIILEALLGPSWGQLWPSWAQLGPPQRILKPTWDHNCFPRECRTTATPPNNHQQTLLRLLSCPSLDGNVYPSNQNTNKPMHKPTSSRGWLGGMRGAIESAATVYGEHGRAKQLVRILVRFFPVPERN